MSSYSAAEQWLSHATGGHPVLVPALILAGILIFWAVVVDFIVTSIIHPVLEKLGQKLGLRNRGAAVESLRSATSKLADPEGPIVIASPSGQCFLTLLPGRSEHGQSTQKRFGTAYKLQSDGQIRELWRVEGWYSFHECFLSDDGRYLVRVIDSPGGSKVKDLAIAFYDRGDLLRQLSTSDLVACETNGLGSISRSGGRGEPKAESSRPSFNLSAFGDNMFRMTTADGITHAFDVTTGEIIPADVRPEPDGVRQHKTMFVAGACVAVASVGAFLALSRRRSK
jgi:hypothetical protein